MLKTIAVICVLTGLSGAQFPWLSSMPCNACFGQSYCFNEDDNLPQECTGCLQNTCESDFDLRSFASRGLQCVAQAWRDPNACQNVCPEWTFYHFWRMTRCSSCLSPCIATVLDAGAGQCEVRQIITPSVDPCVSETTEPCGTCYRANRCFTERELTSYGGICKSYLELKCPDPSNITCLKKAFGDSCSTCPPLTTELESRFQTCELCMDQCSAKQQCLKRCRNDLPRDITKVPCPLCRAFCEINPLDTNCEETRCDCNQCDTCFETCNALEGGDFNLFNPCQCLNNEENAPVKKVRKSRILGGTETCEGDWPWVVHIYLRKFGLREGAVCGGTLFNNRWVVTAAHCFQTLDASLYSVVLGENTLSDTTGREVFRDVVRLQRHPLFDSLNFNYDVAVIELNEVVTYTKYIQPLQIAPPGTPTDNTNSPTFAGSLCTTVGWGVTSRSGTRGSNTLMQLGVRITPRIICEVQTLTGYAQGPVVSPGSGQAPTKFCAGGVGGEDSCNGDSGGSLFCLHDNGQYILHGITSYGTPECGQSSLPGIYTKVAEVSNWINICISANQCDV